MTRQRFEELVQKLERSAAEHLGSYTTKVALLAAAGYVYIFAVLAVLIGVLILLVAALQGGGGGYAIGKLGFIVGALAFTVLRSLWVRWPKPEGILLRRDQAPRLFEEVEAIRAKLRAPQVNQVFLDHNYNAAMEQRPRLGVFGLPQGILHLGLPLMQALSYEEFRAVLAHELGHLSGNHGRMTGWIYRIRMTWSRLLERLESEGRWGSGVFTKFFGWYAPFLNAYSFVLARNQEYQADQCAAEVSGPQIAARALVAVDVRGRFLNELFWPRLWKTANESGEPPGDPYLRQGAAFKEPLPAGYANRWVTQSLAVKTGYVDTHPSLRDRLDALGAKGNRDWAGQIESVPKRNAAEELLGTNPDPWYRQLHAEWLASARPNWSARYAEAQENRKRLRELEDRGKQSALTEEDEWELARLTADMEGDEAAIPLLRCLLEKSDRHVSANFELGRILLARSDEAGLHHLGLAMQDDPQCTIAASFYAEQFCREQGRIEDADRYRNRAIELAELRDEADRERANVSPNDIFREHGVDSEVVLQLREHLRRYPNLKEAFLVRKEVRTFPDEHAFVLGIVPSGTWFRSSPNEADMQLLDQVAGNAPMPRGTYVVLLNSANRKLRKRIGMPGASVFRR